MTYSDLLSFLGLSSGGFLAIIGITVSFATFVAVLSLDRRRRNEEEKYAKNKINVNLNQSLTIFNQVISITELKDTTEGEQSEITNRLEVYFNKQFKAIPELIENTERNLGDWKSLSEEDKKEIDQVSRCLNWLIDEYYPHNASMSERQDSWPPLRKELIDNRDLVQGVVTKLSSQKRRFSFHFNRKNKNLEISNLKV